MNDVVTSTKGDAKVIAKIYEIVFDHFAGLSPAMSGYNDHYKTHYSTFQDITKVLYPRCKEHGLVFAFRLASTAGLYGVAMDVFLREHPETVVTSVAMVPAPNATGNGIQDAGKVATYFKRYLPAMFFQLQAEIENGNFADGDAPSKPQGKQQDKPKAPPKPQPLPKVVAKVDDLKVLCKLTDGEAMYLWSNIDFQGKSPAWAIGAVKKYNELIAKSMTNKDAIAEVRKLAGQA